MTMIFVSYSRKNEELVLRLVEDLTQQGYSLWLDKRDIQPGHRWDVAIENALNSATHILLIMSSESVQSNNVRDEIDVGLDSGKIIIPILTEDCDLPMRIRRLQYMDFRKSYDQGLATLIKILPSVASQTSTTTIPPNTAKAEEPQSKEPVMSPSDLSTGVTNIYHAGRRPISSRRWPVLIVALAIGIMTISLYIVGVLPSILTPRVPPTATRQVRYAGLPGLIAYFPFDGDANDMSGNGNDGVAKATMSTGRSGGAYSFNGVNDSVTVEDNLALHLTEQISIATWVFPTAQKTQEIVRKGPGIHGLSNAAPYALALSGTGDVVFSLLPAAKFIQVRKAGYPLDIWFFVVGTYDGTTMKLYVNGKLENSASASGFLNEDDSALLIGTRLSLAADTFQGKIDDVRIYNRALAATEIEALYKE